MYKLDGLLELFVKIIHAHHVSGDIFDVGSGELRKQFERDMRKMN
jgi:hypothetical protein